MEKFAIQKAKEGKMNANYAVLISGISELIRRTPGQCRTDRRRKCLHTVYTAMIRRYVMLSYAMTSSERRKVIRVFRVWHIRGFTQRMR